MFVRATLTGGDQVVSEFDRLRGIRSLSGNVMSGRRPFPVWKVVGTHHTFSAEPKATRTREFINGSMIKSMQIVEPVVEDHGYNPEMFRPVARMDAGSAGLHRFTEETLPEGVDVEVSTDIDYPCHRAPDGRRYVVLHYRSDAGDPDVEYYLDDEAGTGEGLGEVFAWDDEDALV